MISVSKFIAFLSLSAFLFGCKDNHSALDSKEEKTTNELIADVRTVCVGRFLIDVPSKIVIRDVPVVDGISIQSSKMSQADFAVKMNLLEKKYSATKHVDGYRFFYGSTQPQGENTRQFVRLKNEFEGDIGRVIEAYKWDDGVMFILQVEGRDVSDEKYQNDAIAKQIRTNVPELKTLMGAMLKGIRARKNELVPTEPGFCFNNGFLPGKAIGDEESSTLLGLLGKSDVNFDIVTDTGIRESDSLLERMKSIEETVSSTKGGRVIRKGKVVLKDISAEELLLAGETALHIPGHIFGLTANEKSVTKEKPYISLDMANGGASIFTENKEIANASLSENEALALWDTVSRTLRPRPNAF